MTTTPPTITSLPAAPDPNNRATFNTLAYPWSAALPAFGTQVSAVGANVKANADEVISATDAVIAAGLADAAANAATATAGANTATTQAGIATTKASEANASAIAAAASVASIAGGPVASVNGMTGVVTGIATVAGVQSLTNKTITDIVFTLTGTTPAFTATNGGVQTWTLSGASTPTNSLTTGQSIILVITPGANTITWPVGTIWTKQGGSGAAPTLFSAGKTSVVLWVVGAVLYGSHLGDTA